MKKFLFGLLLLTNICFADTLTVYPDAGSGNTTVDGDAKITGADVAFSTLVNGAGTSSSDTSTLLHIHLRAGNSSSNWRTIGRIITTYDTSSLGTEVTIDSAKLSWKISSVDQRMGITSVKILDVAPTSNNAVVNADYNIAKWGNTVFASETGFVAGNTKDFILNQDGIDNISLDGISVFGARSQWDYQGYFTGSWSIYLGWGYNFYSSDNAGTTNDPKLIIEYSEAADINSLFFGFGF